MSESVALPLRSGLLNRLARAHDEAGCVPRDTVVSIARELRIPIAEAWEAATSYPEFRVAGQPEPAGYCAGLSCVLNFPGGQAPVGEPRSCRFRCYDAPAGDNDVPFPEDRLRQLGPVLAEDVDDWRGYEVATEIDTGEAVARIEQSGLRGRGGAYFPVARKWRGALEQQRPIALVINAEEGEPGVFKDRAILCRRPGRFVEGLAVAAAILRPAVTIIFINGLANAARASLEHAIEAAREILPPIEIVRGGGGYILGEETTMLSALEGRKPVPRLKPPYPAESGLFGMPTVTNNVETIANLSLIFRDSPQAFREYGHPQAPGTKLLSISGRVEHPGIYEVPFGITIADALKPALGGITPFAALLGGPSGGFLPRVEFVRALLPGQLHSSGAVKGSGGIVVLDEPSQVRPAALAMASYNAAESCGKCTPCREGTPRLASMLADGGSVPATLLDAVGAASLCGLGQMAPGPIRSALHFWPELFA